RHNCSFYPSPYTTRFRSEIETELAKEPGGRPQVHAHPTIHPCLPEGQPKAWRGECGVSGAERVRKTQGDLIGGWLVTGSHALEPDRKSTRLNSSHVKNSY